MRPDGNCRSCMVEIKGERVLAPSCCRKPAAGHGGDHRQPARAALAEDGARAAAVRHAGAASTSSIRELATLERASSASASRASRRASSPTPTCRIPPSRSTSTPASSARAACAPAARSRSTTSSATPIRGGHSSIVFDLRRPDGRVDLRGVRRMRAGLPHRRADAGARRGSRADRQDSVDSVCPYCGVGCQLTYHVKDNKILRVEGRDGPANHEPPVRQGPLRLRLRAPSAAPDQAADPPRRHAEVRRLHDGPGRSRSVFREATWEEALDARRRQARADPRHARPERAGRLRLGQGQQRGGVPLPEARAHGLRHQQRRPLHAAVPRVERRRAARRHRLGRGVAIR